MVFRRNLTIALFTALIGMAPTIGPSAAQETAPLVPEGPWVRVEIEGFVIFGNAPEERLRSLATDGERLRHAIGQVAIISPPMVGPRSTNGSSTFCWSANRRWRTGI